MKKVSRKRKSKILPILLCFLCIIMIFCFSVYCIYSQYDGVYVCKDYESIGIEFSIKLKGEEFEISALGVDTDEKTTGIFHITDNKIRLSVEETVIEGVYDKDQNCLIIDGFIFYKE